jgi:hydrogenase maturation protease
MGPRTSASANHRVLVAGIGNIFLGDDGFGVEVANRLAGEPMPDGVRVGDFGIRGVHLAYELLDGYDTLVLIDAMSCGDQPGTITVLEPELDPAIVRPAALDAHRLSPEMVLATLASLGGQVTKVLVIGCQPAVTDPGIGLSREVEAAVDPAAEVCREVLKTLRDEIGPNDIGKENAE